MWKNALYGEFSGDSNKVLPLMSIKLILIVGIELNPFIDIVISFIPNDCPVLSDWKNSPVGDPFESFFSSVFE